VKILEGFYGDKMAIAIFTLAFVMATAVFVLKTKGKPISVEKLLDTPIKKFSVKYSDDVSKFLEEISVVILNRYYQHGYSHFKHDGVWPTSQLLRDVVVAVKKEFGHDIQLQHAHDNVFLMHKIDKK
jgi:hypothetical protein